MTGHNSIRMTDLQALYRKLGYNDAETYIQSGNVIFSSVPDLSPSEISSKLERAIRESFNYEITVLIRKVEEIKKLESANPFLKMENFDPSKMAVLFLDQEPSEAQIQKVINIDYPPDKFEIIGSEIFIYCPNGFGKTKLYTNFFERKMDVAGTGRNWRTINKLLEIAEKK
jgi:uncharacterized protein (DUF1697 family)